MGAPRKHRSRRITRRLQEVRRRVPGPNRHPQRSDQECPYHPRGQPDQRKRAQPSDLRWPRGSRRGLVEALRGAARLSLGQAGRPELQRPDLREPRPGRGRRRLRPHLVPQPQGQRRLRPIRDPPPGTAERGEFFARSRSLPLRASPARQRIVHRDNIAIPIT